MVELADTIFRDFQTDGVPASGAHKPQKSKIREWGAWLEGRQTGSSMLYGFSAATADADPGSGLFRLNNAAAASATMMFIDDTDAAGESVGAVIAGWDDSTNPVRGTITFRGIDGDGFARTYNVTGSVADGTGYRKVTIVHVGGHGEFDAAAQYVLTFARAGDAIPSVANIAALKAEATSSGRVVVLTETGRKGTFAFATGNLSALVTADPRNAIWVAPNTDPSGASGAWVRQRVDMDMNVRWCGAVADGATDDQPAIQAALNLLKTQGGGVLRLPASASNYKINAGLSYDISALVGRFNSRIRIVGDGAAVSCLSLTGVATAALTITGPSAYSGMYAHLEGFRLTGDNTVGSKGLSLSVSAFGSSDGMVIEAFDYCLDCTDVEQTAFYNSNFRWGIHGVRFNAAVSATSANSLLFVNCAISNHTKWGMQITNANAVSMHGGSIQYNGTVGGGATEWGAKITEAGNGYGNVLFHGVAFEGNGGDADLISEQSTYVAAFSLIGCGFARPSNAAYATNFMQIAGTTASTYSFSANTFRGYNTYVANAARPYFSLTNAAAKIHDDGTNVFGSATEQPGWAAFGLFARMVGTDVNGYLSGPFTRSDGISIGSLSDNFAGLRPIEFRTTELIVSGQTGYSGVLKVAAYLSATATYDPPSLADAAGTTTTITVTGAALGDVAMASFSLDTSGITITAWVSATNTVSVRFQNESGGVLDIASGTLKAIVLKP
jgi:hypothetical protein